MQSLKSCMYTQHKINNCDNGCGLIQINHVHMECTLRQFEFKTVWINPPVPPLPIRIHMDMLQEKG